MHPPHAEIPLATPLAAFLRVPLSWYHSSTQSFFDDESHAMIRRVYTHPSQQHAKRHFCGFCGTPLSYWSERPAGEAEYMNVTLGSLLSEDLRDLEELGLIPDLDELQEEHKKEDKTTTTVARQSYGVPWFDSLVDETRLGRLRRTQGQSTSQDGKTRVEWEIVEWTDGGDTPMTGADDDTDTVAAGQVSPAKRKLQDRDEEDESAATAT